MSLSDFAIDIVTKLPSLTTKTILINWYVPRMRKKTYEKHGKDGIVNVYMRANANVHSICLDGMCMNEEK